MKIENISTVSTPGEGIKQIYAIDNTTIIMLNEVKKNRYLTAHKHPHLQFDYCFYGEYSSVINNEKKIVIKERENFLINGNLLHSQHSQSDCYSFSLMFLGKKKEKNIIKNLFNNEAIESRPEVTHMNLNGINLFKFTFNGEPGVKYRSGQLAGLYYLMVSENIKIEKESKTLELLPKKIYTLSLTNGELSFFSEGKGELFLVQLPKIS